MVKVAGSAPLNPGDQRLVDAAVKPDEAPACSER